MAKTTMFTPFVLIPFRNADNTNLPICNAIQTSTRGEFHCLSNCLVYYDDHTCITWVCPLRFLSSEYETVLILFFIAFACFCLCAFRIRMSPIPGNQSENHA